MHTFFCSAGGDELLTTKQPSPVDEIIVVVGVTGYIDWVGTVPFFSICPSVFCILPLFVL